MQNIAVVGAGASGLMAAILLAQKGFSVSLFEAGSRAGRKIAASGNGHCNISNQNISLENFTGFEPQFANFSLQNFTFQNLQNQFKRFGMLFDIKDDGKAYPLSHDAKSVVALLLMNAQLHGVKLLYEQKVLAITKSDHFDITTQNDLFKGFDKVILATGSVAAEQLGGNESGYDIVQSFGHTLTPLYPSLVQLELEGDMHKAMSGVKKYSSVTLLVDKEVQDELSGDVLFTHYGISGLAILDLSQKASLALILGSRVEIVVNLLPHFERQKLDSQIHSLCKQLPDALLHTLLCGLIHSKIVTVVLKKLKLPLDIKASQSDAKVIKSVVNQLINWKFHVKDTHGFKYAEVSGGGVVTSEVNPKTMESLKQEGLYIVGELLDVVGDRGGYNFHFAWASAFCAAQAIMS